MRHSGRPHPLQSALVAVPVKCLGGRGWNEYWCLIKNRPVLKIRGRGGGRNSLCSNCFSYLFFAKIACEEVNLFIVKGLFDIKHVDTVASL